MKSIIACAWLSLGALAALSIGCVASSPDQEDAVEQDLMSEEPTATPQDWTLPPPSCPDISGTQTKLQICPVGPAVTCTRYCVYTRHWSILQSQCVIDSTSCEPWVCPPC